MRANTERPHRRRAGELLRDLSAEQREAVMALGGPLRTLWGGAGTINDMKEAPMRVTLTEPGLAGSYDVVEHHDDGTLVLRPETSDEVIEQFADRPLSEAEFTESFDRLDAALEREGR